MRRTLRLALIAASLVASTAFASPTNPQNGVEYVTLAAPQPVQATGKKVEVVTYPDAPHAFCNDMKTDSYRPDLTAQAWERSAVFLKSCFQGT